MTKVYDGDGVCLWDLRRCEAEIFSKSEYDRIIKTFEPKRAGAVCRTRFDEGLKEIQIHTKRRGYIVQKFCGYLVVVKDFSNSPDKVTEIYKI